MAEGARPRQWVRLLVPNCVAVGIAVGGTVALMRSSGGSSWSSDIALATRFVLPPTLVVAAMVSGIILWGRVFLGAAEIALSIFVIVLAGTQGGFYLMMIAAASGPFGPGGGG